MKIDDKVIAKVLALFDKEDIPYIKANIFFEYKNESNQYVKKIGDKNDGYRKR